MAGSYQMKLETPAAIGAQVEALRVVEAVSPTAVVEATEDGARITIHDLHGTTTAQVYNGKPGAAGPQGEPGTPGRDGVSPTATVTQTATGAVLTVTDAEGTTTAEISNGQDGAPGAPGAPGTDGVSPSISVTDITGGHRVTITDATGAHSFDVMDGDSADAPVQDVQVNGTSILDAQGVANVPIASLSEPGVAKVSNTYGLDVGTSGQHVGFIRIVPAPTNRIKGGDGYYNPVTTNIQHSAAFYGLAKAAGSDEKNSTLPVGQYTDAAKKAIRQMLGIPNFEGELIADVTTTEDLQSFTVNTDVSGQPFVLRVAKCYAVIPASLTGTNDFITAQFSSKKPDGTNNSMTTLPTFKMANKDGSLNTYEVEAYGAFYINRGYSASKFNSTASSINHLNTDKEVSGITGFRILQYGASTTLIPAGTRMLIYGVRA